jgi:hypothetical protein
VTYTSTALKPSFVAIVLAFSAIFPALAAAPRSLSNPARPRLLTCVLGSQQLQTKFPDQTVQLPDPLSYLEQALHRSLQSGEEVAAAATQNMKNTASRAIWSQVFQNGIKSRGPVVGMK